MRELDADAKERIKRLLEGETSKATLAMYLGRAMRDLDEADRELEEIGELVPSADYFKLQREMAQECLALRAKLAEAETLLAKNSLYRVWKKRIEEMVSLQEKLAEAEAKASAAEAINEANYAEYAALREVERAIRANSWMNSAHRCLGGDCPDCQLGAALAAVDALRKEKA